MDAVSTVLAPVAQEIHRHWLTGDPAHAIMRLAAQLDADAIVVGAKRRGALASAILGSVATARFARSDVPVLAVNLPETQTPIRESQASP
ncbi:universal stress protein, UspA family [Cupriavidus basilensis OR16]|uniref:Universal stress protein, UspA family n=1 Tax=Cupriavidus basilensis OR16 TaxID=1127483 RepID=H1RZ06_9BURK|nr:universal stress protein, UspA family [Cupriavidus basilensis OR16]